MSFEPEPPPFEIKIRLLMIERSYENDHSSFSCLVPVIDTADDIPHDLNNQISSSKTVGKQKSSSKVLP